MNTNGHYDVLRHPVWHMIRHIRCKHCAFSVDVNHYRRYGDRSGQPKYNRARATMVRHLHEKHRAELEADAGRITGEAA